MDLKWSKRRELKHLGNINPIRLHYFDRSVLVIIDGSDRFNLAVSDWLSTHTRMREVVVVLFSVISQYLLPIWFCLYKHADKCEVSLP